jgi:hypothetical protein
MKKEQVVEVMVERLNILYRAAAVQNNQSLIELEKHILSIQPQTRSMCSDLYDTLLARNIIKSE